MSKQVKDEPIVNVAEALTKTERYIEQNKKSLTIVTSVIAILVGGFLAYKYWYVPGEEEKAGAEMFKAEQYFEKDSLDKAINGDAVFAGFSTIADDYGITPSGNLAEYYLGIAYLKKGQYQEAIDHLQNFSSKDQVVSAVATGAIGDACMEMGNTYDAISYYIKAAELNPNKFVTPIYLKKAGLANESKGNYSDAVKLFERIKNEYAETSEGKEMDKYIARAKTLGNL